MNHKNADYPVQLTIDYPERLSRLTTLLRILLIIPILIMLELITGYFTGFLFLAPLLMILLFHKYPRWWFNWNVELVRFSCRIFAYMYLLTDQYPSTDDHQRIHADVPYPEKHELNRWLPLIKWALAIPHFIILILLAAIALVIAFIAWLWILITAHYPKPLFNFIVGVMRWNLRVACYAILLTTDKYPPFRLSA